MSQALTLNCYGESVDIAIPNSLKALRKEISYQFLFGAKDTEELIIKAIFENIFNEAVSLSLWTEQDYSLLLSDHPEVKELIIEVNENSLLFTQSKAKILLEHQSLEDQLVSLKLDTLELINKEKEEYAKGIKNYQVLKSQLDEMNSNFLRFSNEIISKHTTQKKLIRKNKKAIEALELAIHPSIIKEECVKGNNDGNSSDEYNIIPQNSSIIYKQLKDINIDWLTTKEKKKRKKKPLVKRAEKIVHKQIKCDGCGMFPIQGIRYNCSVCDNFNYCQRCRNKFGYIHQHTFIGIPLPRQEVLNSFNLEFLAPYSGLNKIIQCKYKQSQI